MTGPFRCKPSSMGQAQVPPSYSTGTAVKRKSSTQKATMFDRVQVEDMQVSPSVKESGDIATPTNFRLLRPSDFDPSLKKSELAALVIDKHNALVSRLWDKHEETTALLVNEFKETATLLVKDIKDLSRETLEKNSEAMLSLARQNTEALERSRDMAVWGLVIAVITVIVLVGWKF
ncbi:hypothetical protein B0T25DRAFT_196113 [Lasiosphaeria hispida]|uniref:Uncharacterized protein n=1 Tax=Lasiosphaeria hispida TaxID=260671 RepID=A0AAJ0HI84_9PEZI|nr:hypothetical protein B0T25DRAFT_196113 [Lasiosphaeria hispida]